MGRFASKAHWIEMTESWIKVWSLNEKEFLKFNREGSLYYLTASPHKEGEDEKGDSEIMQVIQKGGKVEVNNAHVLLGHISKMLLEKSAKLIGWELTSTLTTCDACAKAKAQAKVVTKKASEPASKPGEWLYFDTQGHTLHH